MANWLYPRKLTASRYPQTEKVCDCAVSIVQWRTRFIRLVVSAVCPPTITVRDLLWEGAPIYEGAGVSEFNHIQICVRDVSYILGYFRPIELTD